MNVIRKLLHLHDFAGPTVKHEWNWCCTNQHRWMQPLNGTSASINTTRLDKCIKFHQNLFNKFRFPLAVGRLLVRQSLVESAKRLDGNCCHPTVAQEDEEIWRWWPCIHRTAVDERGLCLYCDNTWDGCSSHMQYFFGMIDALCRGYQFNWLRDK